MSLQTKILGLVEIVLRVPPLFIIDTILKIGLGLSDLTELEDNYQKPDKNTFNSSAPVRYDTTFYKFIVITLPRLLLSILGCIVALYLFIVKTKRLMVVYMHVMSLGLVFISYWTSFSIIKAIAILDNADIITSILDNLLSLNLNKLADPSGPTYAVLQKFFLECVLTFVLNIHLRSRHPILQKLLPISFLTPFILALFSVSLVFLNNALVFAALLRLAILTFVLWSFMNSVIQTIFNDYLPTQTFVRNFGMSAVVEAKRFALSIPAVLRSFWILRVLEHSRIFFISGRWYEIDELTPVFRLIKSIMVSGCDTLTAILGMTSIVSFICHHISMFFQWVLLTEDDIDEGVGTDLAILFYILNLQTGLTGLEPEKRFVCLYRNLCSVFLALLHVIHNIVNPLLLRLSASHNPSSKRQLRALSVCGFLVLCPIVLLYYLWSHHDASTWLLAVSAVNIQVILKVAVSLATYFLFLLDARRDTFWEKLDDYVYYIRAFGSTVELCFGIFLFFNGVWILLFESGSAIKAIMMCAHVYCNIWCDARAGWFIFMKRRAAVHEIESLPEAEEEQLRKLDDICAICYQEMKSAKITRCQHFFHGVCLRKWLYVQDHCPLCHEILHSVESGEEKANNDAPPLENR